MEIWIIRDGEKVGPIHDFEVRHQIDDGVLLPETPAWHEGLAEWRPLGKIDLFAREFELVEAQKAAEEELPEKLPAPRPHGARPPPVPELPAEPRRYIRRFWARWLDLMLYSGFWWLGMWAAGQNIGAALANPWVMFFQYVPWFVAETFLIHHFGATPGKWLLGLKVVNLDGSALDMKAATRRSMRVLFTGIGFGWGLLAIFCQSLSLFTAKRLGTTLWDHVGGHQVLSAPLRPFRVATLVVVMFGALQLQAMVVSPYMIEAAGESWPWLKKEMENGRTWHLPKRS